MCCVDQHSQHLLVWTSGLKRILDTIELVYQMERDYTSLFSTYEAALYADVDQAITKLGLWDWLSKFTPNQSTGWMFCDHPNIEKITSEMKLLNDHSGASFAIILRNIEYIAKHGWPAFVTQVKLRRKSDQ